MTPHRFINDILKPWDELNSLLSKQYAFQPDLSDVSRLAGNIAVSIRHQVDFSDLNDRQVNELSPSHKLISDAGDYWKHGNLRKEERNSTITVSAKFECKDGPVFRFIRNALTLKHRSLGKHDFMVAAAEAARFWMSQHGFNIEWRGIPDVAPFVYEKAARLKFNSKYCMNMSSVQLQFFKMNESSKLVPFDPPDVRFEVYE
jgi:hypothetical protein